MKNDETVHEGDQANSLRKVASVKAPQDVAWRMFTERMGIWWPLATHKIGKAKAVGVVIEPRVGGRWYERGDDGSTCDWGRVLSWEPHSRLVLSWEISADWQYDPKLKTEVEVRFIPEGKDGTRVELEHRHLDRYGRVTTRCAASSTAKAAGVDCLRRLPAPLRLEKAAS
jgi:uncharacterized protein YndB with AHSA1/START domain